MSYQLGRYGISSAWEARTAASALGLVKHPRGLANASELASNPAARIATHMINPGTYRSIDGFKRCRQRTILPRILTSAAAISTYPAERNPACITPQPGFLPFHSIQPSSRALSLASFHARVRKVDRLIEVRLSSLSAMCLASS